MKGGEGVVSQCKSRSLFSTDAKRHFVVFFWSRLGLDLGLGLRPVSAVLLFSVFTVLFFQFE